MLYLYYTESKTHDYGKNIQRGAPPPPQLLRAGPPESPVEDAQIEKSYASRSSTYRRPSIRSPRAPCCCCTNTTRVVENRETHAAGDRSRRCVRTHRGEKIERSFAAGYGTVLFFEDTNVVRDLQQKFPGYAGNFPVWSEQTSAMHRWRYGRCSKTPGSARRCNITTR